jgi:hypothetical protein
MYWLFAKEFGCVPIKWKSEYTRVGFFFILKTNLAASIPITCLRHLTQSSVAVVLEIRKLNDNFDCNQDNVSLLRYGTIW